MRDWRYADWSQRFMIVLIASGALAVASTAIAFAALMFYFIVWLLGEALKVTA